MNSCLYENVTLVVSLELLKRKEFCYILLKIAKINVFNISWVGEQQICMNFSKCKGILLLARCKFAKTPVCGEFEGLGTDQRRRCNHERP